MINVIKYDQLGYADHGWLQARHHFSFADYYDPKRQGFGALRVINDDVIQAGAGFDTHPHRNMEIITYVREGAITHRDSQGNIGRTEAGDIQVMSAGSGIFHSEFNLEHQTTKLFQIWIIPDKLNVSPPLGSEKIPKQPVGNHLPLLVSGDGKAPLQIHQDAFIYAGIVPKGTEIQQSIKHQAYLLVSDGQVQLGGVILSRGDAAEITQEDALSLKAISDANLLLLDVPDKRR